jgi:hypothetical protein
MSKNDAKNKSAETFLRPVTKFIVPKHFGGILGLIVGLISTAVAIEIGHLK